MTNEKPIIVWFRNDLRISDHGALFNAAKLNKPIIPIFILDETANGNRILGGASKWWLHNSLLSLEKSLNNIGLNLVLKRGNSIDILSEIFQNTNAQAIYCQRNYDGPSQNHEKILHQKFGNNFKRFGGNLLFEPEAVNNQSGNPFLVFTPFFKSIMARNDFRNPYLVPENCIKYNGAINSDSIKDWALLPTKPDWAQEFKPLYTPGENGAHEKLEKFLNNNIKFYGENRDRPDLDITSKLSPHLRFGELSPTQIWHKVNFHCGGQLDKDCHKFISELAWREFSYHLLFRQNDIATKAIKANYEQFPWEYNEEDLQKWQKGQTGYPIVDAGMRELWRTGFMHNRVRMIVASFLIKDLLIDWRHGEKWFWDCLVDADDANNPASWQWVAGSGMDAAPYFRIFNPTTQGQKFDPKGEYIKKWVPEIANLPIDYIHSPDTAPPMILKAAGVKLGVNYPLPMINHKFARDRALLALKAISNK